MNNYFGLFLLGLIAACGVACGTRPNPVALSPKDLRDSNEKSTCPVLFKENAVCASLEWVDEPYGDQTGELTLKFWAKNAATINGPYSPPLFKPFIKLWMRMGAGHGSDRPVELREEAPGLYRARDVHFSMKGAWEIWVQLRQENQVIEQVILDIKI